MFSTHLKVCNSSNFSSRIQVKELENDKKVLEEDKENIRKFLTRTKSSTEAKLVFLYEN